MKNHQHRVKWSGVPRCFSSCVNPERCKPEAHGNITVLDKCACGATREVNINGNWIERREWSDEQ